MGNDVARADSSIDRCAAASCSLDKVDLVTATLSNAQVLADFRYVKSIAMAPSPCNWLQLSLNLGVTTDFWKYSLTRFSAEAPLSLKLVG
jgi:hypothetical protein